MPDWDIIVIGAGLAGAVVAERFATASGKRVLVLEKQELPGGHCRDEIHETGIFLHHHGPHIFHTSNRTVWEYLSRFTDWIPYEHKVRASVSGKLIPLPFNLESLEMCFSSEESKNIIRSLRTVFGNRQEIHLPELLTETDMYIRRLGRFIYDNIFHNYTKKQWGGMVPEELGNTVINRIPIRLNREARYFTDPYQGIPKKGYTAIIESLLNQPGIVLRTGINGADLVRVRNGSIFFENAPFHGKVINTGLLDEIFEFRFGRLPYRSLRFDIETVAADLYQETAVINYPNNHDYTRITEFKHFQLCQESDGRTLIAREYPADYVPGVNHPYYIVPSQNGLDRAAEYIRLIQAIPNFIPLGRLGEYRYFNMDEVVLRAIDVHRKHGAGM